MSDVTNWAIERQIGWEVGCLTTETHPKVDKEFGSSSIGAMCVQIGLWFGIQAGLNLKEQSGQG